MTPQPKPVRALVVDDDEMSRELLAVLLQGEGYAVETADSGESALALVRGGERPDLVLTDVQLPGVSGAELAAELGLACGPATFLLAMSGSQPPAEAIERFDGFLLKPFQMKQVAAALIAGKPRVSLAAGKPKKGTRRDEFGTFAPPQPAAGTSSIYASADQPASKSDMPTQLQESPIAEMYANDRVPRAPVLNEKIYSQLARSMPTRQLHEMYAMCMNDARARIGAMREMVAAHDAARFVREAHAIKGGCGMLGASELHVLAAELETKGLAGGPVDEARDVNSLDELAAACDRLERMLDSRV